MPSRNTLGYAAILALAIASVLALDLVIFPLVVTPAGPKRTSASETNSELGLQLTLSLNSTRVAFGRSIEIAVDERNTLPRVNNVTAASDWPAPGLDLGAGPRSVCPERDDVGIIVYQGPLGSGNVSSVTGEQIAREDAICPGPNGLTYSYQFQPSSDNATEAYGCKLGAPSSEGPGTTCGCGGGPCPPLGVKPALTQKTLVVSGYYVNSSLHALAPGEYSVVAGDEWGDVAIAQFEVTSPGCKTLDDSMPFPALQARTIGVINEPGAWAFTANLDSTVGYLGRNVTVRASLVSVGNTSETIELVTPIIARLQVLRSDGSVAWTYPPPFSSGLSFEDVSPDQRFSGTVGIPTGQLQLGQNYTVVVSPEFYASPPAAPISSGLGVTFPLMVC